MHIPDGVLATPVIAGGWVVACAATAWSARGVTDERIPRAAVATACFFVASTIHVPVGVTSLHLVLNGLCGVILGRMAFVAIALGLALQLALFNHGGLSTLGFNACAMGLPALAAGAAYRRWRRTGRGGCVSAFLAGFGALVAADLIVTGALIVSGEALAKIALPVLAAHGGVAVIEGLVTAQTVRFLDRVEPRMLGGHRYSVNP